MAFDFPASPAENQEFTPAGGPTYVYKAPHWTVKPVASGGASTIISDTPPASPTAGQFWWESDSGNLFVWFTDADTSQWVQVNIAPPTSTGVLGPTTSTDNAIARFDSTTGKLIQNSAATIDDSGNITAPNLITGVNCIPIGSSLTYNKPAGLKFLGIKAMGGGGAGGGTAAVSASMCAGSGGGAGSYGETLLSSVPTAITITIGAGGVGVSGGNGGAGGATVLSGSGMSTLTANGGNGGARTSAVTTMTTVGGASGGTAVNFQVNGIGQDGTAGYTHVSTQNAQGGYGGSTVFGSGGGNGPSSNSPGAPGRGYGSGGNGAAAAASGSLAALIGGDGRIGFVYLTEYF